jgi:two-component system, chemotaxis family, chemotaxis protein CheY
MIEILRKMFEANPEKSTNVLNCTCSDCGCKAIIEITKTSGGFGLQGGVLFKSSHDGYLAKCSVCNQANPKIDDNQKIGQKFIKILLVEDELISRRMVKSFLSPFGEVDVAVNANEAFTAVKKAIENNQPYELIFLDIMMPKLDGIAILKKIRYLENQQGFSEETRSKVIMTSSNSDKNIILKAARADCTGYIIKPIDKTRLYNEIHKHGFDIPE